MAIFIELSFFAKGEQACAFQHSFCNKKETIEGVLAFCIITNIKLYDLSLGFAVSIWVLLVYFCILLVEPKIPHEIKISCV